MHAKLKCLQVRLNSQPPALMPAIIKREIKETAKKRGKSSNQKAILKSFEAKPFCLILEKLMRKAVC